MAMLGFAGIALAELQTGVPAAEQFANDVAGVSLLAVALTFASIFPKFVSGCSLKVRRWPGKHLPWQPTVVQQPCSDDVDAEWSVVTDSCSMRAQVAKCCGKVLSRHVAPVVTPPTPSLRFLRPHAHA